MSSPARRGGLRRLSGRAAEARDRCVLLDAVDLHDTCRAPRCGDAAPPPPRVSTGAKQASVPSMMRHHSSRVRDATAVGDRRAQLGPLARRRVDDRKADARIALPSRPSLSSSCAKNCGSSAPMATYCCPWSRRCRSTAPRRPGSSCRVASCEHAARAHAVEHREQRGRAVDHRGVHDLARVPTGGDSSSAASTPNASSMPPPPKSPTRLSGGTGVAARAADQVQRAGQRDVVDVVTGRVRQRAVLAPAGHAAVDQPRDCARGTARVRGPAARARRAGSLRSARRRAPAASARPRRRPRSSGPARSSAGCAAADPAAPARSAAPKPRSTG